MVILTIRTDKPVAELGLYKDSQQLTYRIWFANQQLAETIHIKLRKLLKNQDRNINELEGIVVFKGPGSFTGLRIGLTIANALAYSQSLPVVAEDGTDWIKKGIKRLQLGEDEQITAPQYGSSPHITTPKK